MTGFFLLIAASTTPDLPVAPPPRIVERRPLPAGIDPALADWTPRPATGKAEPWEKATDVDWIDGRFRLMNTGPALNCTMKFPLGKAQETIYKATVVKLGDKGDAGVVFDRSTMRLTAGWTGGYLNHSDRRFGLLNTPTPKGEMVFDALAGPGWADPEGKWDVKPPFTAPLVKQWVKYLGMYHHGDRTVLSYSVGGVKILESPSAKWVAGHAGVATTFEIEPHDNTITRYICDVGGDEQLVGVKGAWILVSSWGDSLRTAVVTNPTGELIVQRDKANRRFMVKFNPNRNAVRVTVAMNVYPKLDVGVLLKRLSDNLPVSDFPDITKAGPKLWGEPIITPLVKGNESGPFAVDTLTIPYKNLFGALFFCTGLDHLPDGRIAVCTCHGDVWLVTVDEKAGACSWQRFATGLYHPLGLKVVDGKVVVLERGQLTRLHDNNNDGEADFYECITNDWHTGAGEHSYDSCLETDPNGNFYFFKTGDTNLPSGGCLLRAAKDGSKVDVFCTGFRHPIGLGMSPTGVITGADQEGNWMPATRIDQYTQGGFYGDMRALHRETPPKLYDGPLCWVPREIDNSAGGQVWVPPNTFGPLAGLPLHFSYGRCRPFVLLRQECDGGVMQGGVTALDVNFLSGVCRGRFGKDGHLYVCGLNGWQTAAKSDGCLQRVRWTGKPLDVPVKMAIDGNTIRLTFCRPLSRSAVESVGNYKAAWWNYRWSGEYGSDRWKVSDPKVKGQDEFSATSATLLGDGRTVVIRFAELKPVMQMQIGYNIAAADGTKVVGSVFLTIHATK